MAVWLVSAAVKTFKKTFNNLYRGKMKGHVKRRLSANWNKVNIWNLCCPFVTIADVFLLRLYSHIQIWLTYGVGVVSSFPSSHFLLFLSLLCPPPLSSPSSVSFLFSYFVFFSSFLIFAFCLSVFKVSSWKDSI